MSQRRSYSRATSFDTDTTAIALSEDEESNASSAGDTSSTADFDEVSNAIITLVERLKSQNSAATTAIAQSHANLQRGGPEQQTLSQGDVRKIVQDMKTSARKCQDQLAQLRCDRLHGFSDEDTELLTESFASASEAISDCQEKLGRMEAILG